jgi:hypothetical protein
MSAGVLRATGHAFWRNGFAGKAFQYSPQDPRHSPPRACHLPRLPPATPCLPPSLAQSQSVMGMAVLCLTICVIRPRDMQEVKIRNM